MAGNTLTKSIAGSQRLLLYGGLMLAAISAILVFMIASGQSGGGNAVAVLTAKQDIPAQTRINLDMLEVRFVNPDEAVVDAYNSRGQAIDHVAVQNIAAGAQIVPNMLSQSAGEGLAFVVASGMRAVSIEVQEVVTAGGNIEPGDRVDIIGLFEVSGGVDPNAMLAVLAPGQSVDAAAGALAGRAVLTVTLLQDVKVLGVAQSLAPQPAGEGATDTADVESQPRASTATLELTPQQAQVITLADEFGILRMAARGLGDAEVAPLQPSLIPLERSR